MLCVVNYRCGKVQLFLTVSCVSPWVMDGITLQVGCTHLVIFVFMLSPSQMSHENCQVCRTALSRHLNVAWITNDEKWIL